MSWDSATGLVELWVNGYPLPRMGLKKGYSINPEASIVLGQDQNQGFLGWVFDINTSFQGEMTDVYMWDRVLSADEVNLVWNDQAVSNSLINWSSLDYEITYYVMIMPSLISG
ncbi:hypothetical protein JRQ81_009129 [Phrynocephalus forsythii]|uniref:Pentraxin (PTX) domain-containing protein n=1 Tax=Phrynocephalus forsythii TaxID=171643 RepID=A0A9Q1ARW2_9SAUR|nr:hypothetical protein JRQ81_009129 [Phrynocephalus forsythii]